MCSEINDDDDDKYGNDSAIRTRNAWHVQPSM